MNDAEWFAEHTAYLATPEWAFRRGQVLNRDGYRCQARMQSCAGDAVQVHHLNYRHWRNEPLFDLVSVCLRCHEQVTAMDRASRPPDARLVEERGSSVLTTRQMIRHELSRGDGTMAELIERTGLTAQRVRIILQRDAEIVVVRTTEIGERVYGLADIGVDIPGVLERPWSERTDLTF